MKIFFWVADAAGCFYYRAKLPADQLRARGHEVVAAQVMREEYRDSADVLIGQRVSMPGPTQTWQDVASRPNRPLMVYEVDDDLTALDPSNRQPWEFFNKPGVQENIRRNVAVADLVTVSTEPLAEVMRKLNPNVVVLPNCVPAWLLEHEVPARTDSVVTIGWQGSATHDMDWDGPGRQVERFFKQNPGRAELHLMGAPPRSAPRVPEYRWTQWVGNVEDYYRSIDWHLALAPLRPHVFNASKSALRCLEAGALSLPVIASDAGPYSAYVQHGVTGLIARQDHEWMKHLRVLVNDADMRAEMGANARRQAAGYTIEERAVEWEQAYNALMSPVGAR